MMRKIVPTIPSHEIDSCEACPYRCPPTMPDDGPVHCDLTKGDIIGDIIPEWCPLADVPTD